MGIMTGKRGLIMGLANDKSLAWGIAKALAPMSAETAARLERALAPTGDFAAPVDLARQAERTATRDRLLALA